MQWLLSWITVTSAYVNIICVFTITSHHLAVVGAVLFHSFCMNLKILYYIHVTYCVCVCVCYGDTTVIPAHYVYFLHCLYAVEMHAISTSAGTFLPVNTVFE
jgi:hypothetical protein